MRRISNFIGIGTSLIMAASTVLAAAISPGQVAVPNLSPSILSVPFRNAAATGGSEKSVGEPLLPSADGPQFVAVSIHAVDMKQDTSGFGQKWNGTHMSMHNQTPEMLIWDATGISNPARIIGLPDRLKASEGGQKYDLQGAAESRLDSLTNEQYKNMVLSLLTSRFGLKAHMEMRDEAVWKLTVAKGGLKHVGPPEKREDERFCWSAGHPGYMKSHDCTLADLADNLAEVDDLEVINATEDTNRHAFELRFDDWATAAMVNGYRFEPEHNTDALYPGLYSALPEQLGLKLVKGTAQQPVVVIDHISVTYGELNLL